MPLAESARATCAAESRFRIDAPNARPRAMMIVALDGEAAALVAGLAAGTWRGATFLTTATPATRRAPSSFASWLQTITGQAIDLAEAAARADMVHMLTFAGADASAAPLIGEACGLRGVKTSGLVIDTGGAPLSAVSRSLRALRPWAVTLSVIRSADDVGEILHALGG